MLLRRLQRSAWCLSGTRGGRGAAAEAQKAPTPVHATSPLSAAESEAYAATLRSNLPAPAMPEEVASLRGEPRPLWLFATRGRIVAVIVTAALLSGGAMGVYVV
jgi:hypothetical protein